MKIEDRRLLTFAESERLAAFFPACFSLVGIAFTRNTSNKKRRSALAEPRGLGLPQRDFHSGLFEMEGTFIFVDLAGFTALTETHGDDAAASLVDRFVAMAERVLLDEGRLISVVGDALFLVSPKPQNAVPLVERLLQLAELENEFPEIRAGIHHGEAAERGPQLYGHAVNVAARIAGHARGGQVLCSDAVASAARDAGIPVEPIGRVELKNVRTPLALFSVSFRSSAHCDPIDPVCRMRVSPERAAAHINLGQQRLWFCSRECLALYLHGPD